MQKLARRTYFMLVELASGQSASLTIIRDKDHVAAQLLSFNDYLKQVGFSVKKPGFEGADVWVLLAYVEMVFEHKHGIRYEYLLPRDVTPEDWVEGLEQRANDPRYFAAPSDDGKGWSYSVRVDDMPSVIAEMRIKDDPKRGRKTH
ncbi:hypothetical protein [Rhizobium sp. IMFF44]|uniref:hypothetical protein n=1 Tax=Rhizobium sp. IMFF44 TaxID=3342350 RepID=UPI0035B98E61